MAVVIIVVVALVVVAAFWRGRSVGYHDGYFKGYGDARVSAKLEKQQNRFTVAQTTRIARAAYNRGYRKAVEDMKDDSRSRE